MTTAIFAKDLSFSYSKTAVLKEVELNILENQFVALFGPNGGGKTTLLNLILGFLTPTKGRIEVFGSTPKMARKSIGWVPQNLHYDHSFPISAFEVVLTGLLRRSSFLGGYSKEEHFLSLKALEKVDMAHFKNTPFSDLSGGEAQRVLIARALVQNPKLLLLDEPTSNVDVKAKDKIYQFLTSLKREMTILMVTHDLKMATQNVDRVLCVQTTLTSLDPTAVCEHFAIGLYHPPISG